LPLCCVHLLQLGGAQDTCLVLHLYLSSHFLVARIAYDKIMKDDSSIMTRANNVLAYLSEFTTLEKDHPFVECATFADEIKSKGWDDQSEWHFVDNPFMDDGFNTDVAPQDYNVTWIIVFHFISIFNI
jgi:hypothetical protein